MKRMLIALAAAAGLGLSAQVSLADPGGFAPPGGPGAAAVPTLGQIGGPNTLLGAGDLPPGRGPDLYGLNPCLKRFFHLGPGGRCGPAGCAPYGFAHGHHATLPSGYGMGGPMYNPGGVNGAMQGTLVFPHQPFVRSPRDFFMYDFNK